MIIYKYAFGRDHIIITNLCDIEYVNYLEKKIHGSLNAIHITLLPQKLTYLCYRRYTQLDFFLGVTCLKQHKNRFSTANSMVI